MNFQKEEKACLLFYNQMKAQVINQDLLRKCRRGDDSSWRVLFAVTYPLSRWVVSHTLFNISPCIIDEIAQDTMIALAQNIVKISDEAHAKRFVKRVARNKSIDYIRRNRELFEDVPEDIPMEEDFFLENHVVEVLHVAVQELKEPCQTIVRSRYLQNRSYKDIAKKVGIEIGQIGVRLNRCLSFLKDFFAYKHISWEDFL